MTLKERLLSIKTYEEFRKQREDFLHLKPDKEIIEHLSKITPHSPNPSEELFKTLSDKNKKIGR